MRKFNYVILLAICCSIFYSCNSGGNKTIPSNFEKPDIIWQDSIIDLGSIKTDTVYNFSFKFKNGNKERLIFKKIETSCGCTDVKVSDTLFTENKIVELIGSLNTSGMNGKVEKYIYVLSNAVKPFIILKIEANARI